ncbi:very short patch repair endonuclease [Collimonas sp. H4R21]|uniref:Very short patch repair endonuclease n=1 Tax=Collimonas rhizosphaerae TaxID=3126357 RepID=A0ABU9PWI8_9BURK
MGLHTPAKPHQWPGTSAQVSARMARVRVKGTEPEQRLSRFLIGQGFEFFANVSSLPGSPDVVFANKKVVVFVHGCFWHGHAGCRRATIPQNNRERWVAKIQANVRRDRRVSRALRNEGWSVLTIWECQRSEKDLHNFLRRLLRKM